MKKEIELPKGATIEIKKNKIVIEYEETFVPKNGDFCVNADTTIASKVLFISDGRIVGPNRLSYHVAQNIYGVSHRPTVGLLNRARPATEEERKELLSELHKIGKDWDAEKIQVVDLKWEPKNGDFCAIEEDDRVYRTLFISNGRTTKSGSLSYHAAKVGTYFRLRPIEGLSSTPRPATEDERTELLEALQAIGKDWDAEKMEIVDLEWVPKEGDLVYYASTAADEKVHQMTYSGAAYHHRLAERGLLFRTRAEAIACTDKMLEAAKQK